MRSSTRARARTTASAPRSQRSRVTAMTPLLPEDLLDPLGNVAATAPAESDQARTLRIEIRLDRGARDGTDRGAAALRLVPQAGTELPGDVHGGPAHSLLH